MSTTLEKQVTPETPAQTLARSLFGFAFLALIAVIVTWIAILFSPVPSFATYAGIRTGIIIGLGIFTLLWLGVCIWLFRAPPENLLPFAQRVTRIFQSGWASILIIFLLFEINLLAFLLLAQVAPTITNPAKFLLVCWSLLIIGMILTVNRNRLSQWFAQTKLIWGGIGITIVGLIVFGFLYLATDRIVTASGIPEQLRGSFDFRPLTFIDENADLTVYRQELSQMQVQWMPYTYWTLEPTVGEYINVDENGLRHTPSFVADPSTARKIYFFGGSTMWGEGARDAYTIPAQVARLLGENDQPYVIENYAQTGYVSTQDMMLFQLQLANDNIPDIAVFYEGFNDIFSAYLQNLSGLPYRENQRVSDVEAGRILRRGQPVLRLPESGITEYDWSLVATEGADAETIANRWFANIRLIQAIAEEYDVNVLFVWHPAIIFKKLTADEQTIRNNIDEENPGLVDLYLEIDEIVRQRVANGETNILILSDIFANDDRTIFHDLVHITEAGNQIVAEAILPVIQELLTEE